MLIAFADLLKKTFPIETLFRLGGDEFARQFSHTNISMSIGIAMTIDGDKEFGELFKRADMALYESKRSGKNTSTFCTR